MTNGKVKKILNIILIYSVLIIVSFVFLFPCLWVIMSSFSETGSLYDFNGFFPDSY